MIGPRPPHVADVDRLAAVRATALIGTAPEPAFDELAALAARLLDAPYGFLTLVDEQHSFWKARIGIPPEGPTRNTVEESFCQYVIATGEPLISGDVAADPRLADNPSIEAMGVRAWAGYPLMSPDGLALGSFCVVDTVVRTWSDTDVEVLRVLSAAAGRELALRSAARRAELANSQLDLLVHVGQALVETLDVEDAVARLARLVVPVLGDWSLVTLPDADGVLRDVGWWHARDEMSPVLDKFAGTRLVGLEGTGATVEALTTRTPVVQNSGALELGLSLLRSEQARDAFRALNPAHYAVWPLVFAGTVHGVLVIARDAGRPEFTPDEIELAANIAQRSAAVLDNAKLYAAQQTIAVELERANEALREASRHDRIVAHALQDAMLTRLPEPEHLHVAARYVTADAADQVGGDWYDALLPTDRPGTVVIGDVAGHDIAAATVMGQLRNLLRTLVWEHADEAPSAIISRLDATMAGFGLSTMATMLLARFDADPDRTGVARTLRWSCAGHPVPVLLDGDGARFLAGRADPPLAVSPSTPRHDHVTTFSPGQTLILFTDGLTEMREHDLDARQAQLLAALDAHRDLGLGELLDATLADMIGTERDDDVAVIAVRLP